MGLTPAEEAEFTRINALAFDLVRKESKGIPPCWLCMSPEAKEEAREALCKHLDKASPNILPYTQRAVENMLRDVPGLDPLMAQWKAAETTYKESREQGNPRAYFAD